MRKVMAMDYYLDVDGKRTLAKSPDYLPRVGEAIVLTHFGKVRAQRHLVTRVEWAIAQEESPAYFNRPKHVVVYVEPETATTAEE
jgi:hypothetical protein